MTNSRLLKKINSDKVKYKDICSDSRKIKKGDIFFAIPGSNADGLKYVNDAVAKGASAIVTPIRKKIKISSNIPIYKVKDIRKEISLAAFVVHSETIEKKIAVTGTNGKTSVTYFLNYILSNLGEKTATIGTLGNSLIKKFNTENLTSPEPVDLSKQLRKLSNNKIKYLVMEASSHGLHQKRFYGLKFDACVLTNISQDHLDYHKTMSHYIMSKLKLFSDYVKKDSKIIINSETKYIDRVKSYLKKESNISPIYFQKNNKFKIVKIKKNKYNVKIVDVKFGKELKKFKFANFPLFQIHNFLLATLTLYSMGHNLTKIQKLSLKCPSVPGRMEFVGNTRNSASVYIDFAHTPDALQNALIEGGNLCKSELHVVFGCGGNRDYSKRPIMGKIASKYADNVVITDDNPRFENAKKIRKEIIDDCKNFLEISDRRKAIKHAINQLRKGDLLIIAGKGHEKNQIINGKAYPFDDVKISKGFLKL